jgi:hypothetical protein
MSKSILLVAATLAAAATLSLAAAPNAQAHRHYRHGGVSVYVGGPMVYGGSRYYRYRGYDAYAPVSTYYRGFEPRCYRWGWVHGRSGKAKWRCVAW